MNVGAGVRTSEILRQSGKCLQILQISLLQIAFERGYRRMQFVKDEDKFAAGMKRQMAGSRSWLHLHPGRHACKQLSASCIETKDHNFVRSQIARVSELVSWIQHYTVCMRSFLTVSVYARALILFHVPSFAQTAVALDRKNCHVASGVIRNQNKPA